ncbi:MAG TPA: hypothetical protein VM324_04410 [Egibacteraceae bacterium]|jgi:hypothetical protein|nr:hypothetical protein [Egibacteraceae bacterium]
MGDWAGLLAYAKEHHYTLRVTDGEPFGISASVLRQRAVRECWERPYPGVLWLPGSVHGFWRKSAGVLASLRSREAALALRTAAHAHGIIDRPTPLTEVVQPHGRYIPKRRLVTVRTSRRLTDDDVVEVQSLRCTTPARTIADLAGVLTVPALRPIVIDAVQRRIVTPDELRRICTSLLRSLARNRLRQVLDGLAATPVDSAFEWDVVQAVVGRGLEPVTGFPWRCPDGRVIHFDLAFPRAWVAVECDGRASHATGRAFTTDRIRWTQASRDWSLLWVDWTRWSDQRRAIVDDIVARVTTAIPARPPAVPADCSCRRCRTRGR